MVLARSFSKRSAETAIFLVNSCKTKTSASNEKLWRKLPPSASVSLSSGDGWWLPCGGAEGNKCIEFRVLQSPTGHTVSTQSAQDGRTGIGKGSHPSLSGNPGTGLHPKHAVWKAVLKKESLLGKSLSLPPSKPSPLSPWSLDHSIVLWLFKWPHTSGILSMSGQATFPSYRQAGRQAVRSQQLLEI